MKAFLIITIMVINSSYAQRVDKARAFLQRQIDTKKTPGLEYVIFSKDSLLYTFKEGFADLKQKAMIEDAFSFNIYSVTKTFTALAVLQLEEEGKIDINDPIIKYLPTFPYNRNITIKQILSHTSGIPNPMPLRWTHLPEEHPSFNENDFFNQIFEKNKKTVFSPGQKMAYSNLGYVLLGQLISKISGLTYEKYVTQNIISRLDLPPGELSFVINDKKYHAKGYQKRLSMVNLALGFLINKSKFMGTAEGYWKPFNTLYINGAPYGGLISTSGGLISYVQDLLKPHSRLITARGKEMMFSETMTNNNKPTGMCLSWFKGEMNGKRYFSHAGGGGGYYSEIRIYPGEGIGSLVLFNRTGLSDERFLSKVDTFFLEK